MRARRRRIRSGQSRFRTRMLPHSQPGPARRRLVALGITALVALIAGIAVGAGGDDSAQKHPLAATKPRPRAVAKAKGLSLSRQIGQVLMIAFPGTTPPDYVQRALR